MPVRWTISARPIESFDARGYQAALFTALDVGPGWVNADVHWLKGEYRNIQRRVELGPLSRDSLGKPTRSSGARA
ncbi:Outer membrane esterase [Cronobacter dublinensis 582]|nr:Outer membrane esterase [Cronobacter dublinensis 582]